MACGRCSYYGSKAPRQQPLRLPAITTTASARNSGAGVMPLPRLRGCWPGADLMTALAAVRSLTATLKESQFHITHHDMKASALGNGFPERRFEVRAMKSNSEGGESCHLYISTSLMCGMN